MASSWDRVGQAANVVQFTGVDAFGLVNMIVQAAQTARHNRNQCRKLSQRVQIVADLLGKLGIPVLRQHDETWRPLEQLRGSLISAYLLVMSCTEKRSQLYQIFTGAEVASKLREAQEDIDFYIKLIPMIILVAGLGARQATNEVNEDGSNDTAPTQSRLPGNGLSLQYVTQSLTLETLQPQGFDIDTGARSSAWHLVKKNVRNSLFGRMGSYISYRGKSIGDVYGSWRFSYAELKQATRDFSDVVGKGAYGTVFRGELPDRRAVAVKQLHGVGGGEAEFWAEVTIMVRMNHLNLVRLLGFCIDKDRRMLVCEYMPNGSLDKYLFAGSAGGGGGRGGESGLEDSSSSSSNQHHHQPLLDPSSSNQDHHQPLLDPSSSNQHHHQPLLDLHTQYSSSSSSNKPHQQPLLHLHTRYHIAVGVARAIAYLHEECVEWVLHCDIKPENILLEEDFWPKVSDFGLAKIMSNNRKVTGCRLFKMMSKNEGQTMSRICGTRGYMAPEWVIHREPITAKADVYSFGMVLLEIVSGRRNYGFRQESVGSEDWYFPKWAYEKVYVERRIDDILDPRIAASYDDAAAVATVERMVKTAMWCLQDRAEMRPSMGKVVKMLEGFVEITDPIKPTIFCVMDD